VEFDLVITTVLLSLANDTELDSDMELDIDMEFDMEDSSPSPRLGNFFLRSL